MNPVIAKERRKGGKCQNVVRHLGMTDEPRHDLGMTGEPRHDLGMTNEPWFEHKELYI